MLVRQVDVDAVLGDVDDTGLQGGVDLAERHVHDLRAIGGEQRILGRGRLHPHLQTLEVGDIVDLLLAVEVTQAKRDGRQHLGALNGVLDHLAERGDHLWIADRLFQVILAIEDEMDRQHAGLGREGRRVGAGGDDKVDVAGADLLEHLRLLPELRPGELVDDHLTLAQLF